MVTGSGDVKNGGSDGSLSRGVGECTRTTFEGCEALFKYIGRRIHNPSVDVAEFLKAEKVSGMFGVAELITGGLVNRDRTGACGWVCFLASVEGTSSDFHR